MNEKIERPLLAVVMDGVGVNKNSFGNAIAHAKLPNLDLLRERSLYRTIFAHGTHVGLPSDSDIGNSEVGHNALGAGRIFDQGAKLVQAAIESGDLFAGAVWKRTCQQVIAANKSLHLIGLLSDGNVHSHQDHLHALIKHAVEAGVKRIRIHALLDGRDVGECTADVYAKRLGSFIDALSSSGADIQVASGGGRMRVTMDRYGADWDIVERGWKAHVLGEAPHYFTSLSDAITTLRTETKVTDQYLPPFVVTREGCPIGTIMDGDSVVVFNFRGDRAIEICRAFTEHDFAAFDRQRFPDVCFAGMMQYDGDLQIPKQFLVSPPVFDNTVGEYMAGLGLRQFACSETQKYGHVTYFWNGNRSGKFSDRLEEYLEVPSDKVDFDQKPGMKAKEIAAATIERMRSMAFDFGRINFANGDMVGHTGNLEAAVVALEVMDQAIGELMRCAEEQGYALLVTADHGNCDEMFEGKAEDYPGWELGKPAASESKLKPKPKTAHTRNPVPLYLFNVGESMELRNDLASAGLANMANTFLAVMGLPENDQYLPGVIKGK